MKNWKDFDGVVFVTRVSSGLFGIDRVFRIFWKSGQSWITQRERSSLMIEDGSLLIINARVKNECPILTLVGATRYYYPCYCLDLTVFFIITKLYVCVL